MVVVSPAAANGKRGGPVSVRRGFCRKNDINTIPCTPTHAPVISAFAKLSQDVFVKSSFFLLYMPFGGYEWRKKPT